jgi:hypothetical protein
MIMWTGMAMMFMLITSRRDPHQALAIRMVAMVFMGVHGFLHVAFTSLLRHLRHQGIGEAEAALHAYLAPRRISNLDLAIAWGVFATGVHLFRALAPIAAPAAG